MAYGKPKWKMYCKQNENEANEMEIIILSIKWFHFDTGQQQLLLNRNIGLHNIT